MTDLPHRLRKLAAKCFEEYLELWPAKDVIDSMREAASALEAAEAVCRAAQQVKANFMAIDDGFHTGLVPPEFVPLLEPLTAWTALADGDTEKEPKP